MTIWLTVLPMAAAILCYGADAVKKDARLRDMIASAASLCTLALGLFLPDGLQKVLSVLASFVWLGSSLFAREYFAGHGRTGRYQFFSMVTLAGVQGVFLSGDLLTAFVWFEIMSFASWVLVKQEETDKALRAGQTYLAVSVTCGLVSLLGLFFLYNIAGTLSIDGLQSAVANVPDKGRLYLAGALTMCGFAAKAGLFPLHIWLPEAHPAAPAPASAILSCILTKTGVFGMLAVSRAVFTSDACWGAALLIPGAITMVLGAVLALLSVDLKRVLACSSLSQIGFITVGLATQLMLGDENAVACAGTITHMVNHAVIKLTLFTAAGVIYSGAHSLDLNRIRGWGRGKPVLMLCFLSGALAIGGIPGFGGYISKTLLHEGIVEYAATGASAGFRAMARVTEWLFLLTGGLTLSYMTKLFVCLFIEKGPEFEKPKRYMSRVTTGVLAVSALLMPLFGLLPQYTLEKIAAMAAPFMGAEPVGGVAWYSLESLTGAIICVAIAVLVYPFVVRLLLMRVDEDDASAAYVDRLPAWLSLENEFYRPLFIRWLPGALGFVARVMELGWLRDAASRFSRRYIFSRDDDRTPPKEDALFGVYPDQPFLRKGFTDTLSFSLLLLGVGLVAALIYVALFH